MLLSGRGRISLLMIQSLLEVRITDPLCGTHKPVESWIEGVVGRCERTRLSNYRCCFWARQATPLRESQGVFAVLNTAHDLPIAL